MPFEFRQLEIPDVILVQPKVIGDSRGFFKETYKQSEFEQAGIQETFVQSNYSRSDQNVLRGLHFQTSPHAQGKLIGVIKGSIVDVAVDLRKESPTFKKWVAVELTEDNHQLLYVPSGFAHGFCVTSDVADVQYLITAEYSPEHDGGIRWNDPEIGVDWPLDSPLVSDKDAQLPLLKDFDNPF